MPCDRSGPHYQSIQIELTNRCNLSCTTCIRAISDIHLHEQDLSSAAIQALEPAVRHAESVHLQGWGETMLLADLPDRIRCLRVKGSKVSFTTSGSLMTSRQATELVTSGLDSITFSMAGATAQTQDDMRGKGSHSRLWQSMQLLREAKQQKGSKTPVMAVSYLLTEKSVKELPLAVKKCRPFRLNLFAGVHLTHPATTRQQALCLFLSCPGQRFRRLIRRAHWHAFWGGIRLQLPQFLPDLTPICDKNPLASCFVAADGSVSPCVFLNPPTSSKPYNWYTKNGYLPVPVQKFGNLHQEPFAQIWQKPEYRKFRNAFKERVAIYEKEMSRVGCGMDATDKLDYARNHIRKAFRKHPVPDCCHFCSKMEGF